jgi:hypothetical protein
MAKKYCIFATRISSTTGHVLHRRGNELYSTTKTGKLNPLRMYVYNSIINTLKQFASRQEFLKNITSWKTRKLQKPDFLFDVTDGDVWKTFRINPAAEKTFVEESDTNIVFSFNVDWYQPDVWYYS